MQAAGFSMKSQWFVEIFSSALHDYLSYKDVVTLNVPTLKLLKSQCNPLGNPLQRASSNYLQNTLKKETIINCGEFACDEV